MNSSELKFIRREAKSFLDFISLQHAPKMIFVERPDVNECIVNDFYEENNALYVNVDFFKGYNLEFVLLIILHEIFHYSRQGIKDKHNVTLIRDTKHWHFMQLFDVEADLQVVAYLKHKSSVTSFKQYMRILYQGTFVFRDLTIRQPKFERFIGSMISIKNLFDTNDLVVYLPQLFYNSVLLFSANYSLATHGYQLLGVSALDLELWQKGFQDASTMDEDHYVELIEKLALDFLTTHVKTNSNDTSKTHS